MRERHTHTHTNNSVSCRLWMLFMITSCKSSRRALEVSANITASLFLNFKTYKLSLNVKGFSEPLNLRHDLPAGQFCIIK